MIFITFGTIKPSFFRLQTICYKLSDDFPSLEFVIQAGSTPFSKPKKNLQVVKYLSPAQFVSNIKKAEFVVSAGGESTILQLIRYTSSLPLIFPRLKKHQEHVDDQQSLVAHYFHQKNQVIHVKKYNEIKTLLSNAPVQNTNQGSITKPNQNLIAFLFKNTK